MRTKYFAFTRWFLALLCWTPATQTFEGLVRVHFMNYSSFSFTSAALDASRTFSVWQTLVSCFHSCSICEAEAPWPSPLVRGRGPRRESGRWLPRHCHRGSASAPLPSSVRSEGLERSRTRADWRVPQNTVQRLAEKSTRKSFLTCLCLDSSLDWNRFSCCALESFSSVFLFVSQISRRSAVLWCSHHCCTLTNGTFSWTGSCQTLQI